MTWYLAVLVVVTVLWVAGVLGLVTHRLVTRHGNKQELEQEHPDYDKIRSLEREIYGETFTDTKQPKPEPEPKPDYQDYSYSRQYARGLHELATYLQRNQKPRGEVNCDDDVYGYGVYGYGRYNMGGMDTYGITDHNYDGG